jgi:RNA polymerase sigma factor (sigma-70 family)
MVPGDARLVSLARAGSGEAFAALLARHDSRLRRACEQVLSDRHAAADVAQEAVVVAWLQLDRLRDPERFGAWLVGIGRHLTLQALRDGPGRREWPTADMAVLDRRASDAEEPLQRVLERERAAELAGAISLLPAGQRDAVVLFHLAGLSQRDVARRLNTRPGAVRTRLHKGRETLRAHLKSHHSSQETSMSDIAIPATVADVRRTPAGRHVLLLAAADREVPIWIGRPEAEALAACLQDVELPRPSTHTLALALTAASGRSVDRIRITRLEGNTFYAEVILDDGAVVDARPSDALVLALGAGAAIEIRQDVLDATAAEPPDAYADDLAAEPIGDAATLAEDVERRIASLQHREEPDR